MTSSLLPFLEFVPSCLPCRTNDLHRLFTRISPPILPFRPISSHLHSFPVLSLQFSHVPLCKPIFFPLAVPLVNNYFFLPSSITFSITAIFVYFLPPVLYIFSSFKVLPFFLSFLSNIFSLPPFIPFSNAIIFLYFLPPDLHFPGRQFK